MLNPLNYGTIGSRVLLSGPVPHKLGSSVGVLRIVATSKVLRIHTASKTKRSGLDATGVRL